MQLDLRRLGETSGSRLLWRVVSWVLFAWDVLSVEKDALLFCESVNVSEDIICGFVPASALPPALDDSSVISEDLDMGPLWDGGGKGEGEE